MGLLAGRRSLSISSRGGRRKLGAPGGGVNASAREAPGAQPSWRRTFPLEEVKTLKGPNGGIVTTTHWTQRGSAQAGRPGGIGRGCVAAPGAATTTAPRKRAGVQQSEQAEGKGMGTGARFAGPRRGRARPPGGAPVRVIAKVGFGETGSPPLEPILGSKK